MNIKMKAGKLNRLLKEGFTLEAIMAFQQEVEKLAIKEKKLLE